VLSVRCQNSEIYVRGRISSTRNAEPGVRNPKIIELYKLFHC